MLNNLSSNKLYYSISEVRELTGIEPHVLRYWESEFPTFHPRKSRTGQRSYTKKDIEMISHIKKLLYEEKFTIKGAKNKLHDKPKSLQKMPRKVQSSQNNFENQLVFGQIEKEAEVHVCDKDFLSKIRKTLMQLSRQLNKTL